MKRGDVWWYEPPGGEPRPYLIVARDTVIPMLHRVLAVPATTRRRGIPTEVDLDAADGMPRPCVLSVDNTVTVDKAYCTRRITTLGPERMADVCAAVRIAIDC